MGSVVRKIIFSVCFCILNKREVIVLWTESYLLYSISENIHSTSRILFIPAGIIRTLIFLRQKIEDLCFFIASNFDFNNDKIISIWISHYIKKEVIINSHCVRASGVIPDCIEVQRDWHFFLRFILWISFHYSVKANIFVRLYFIPLLEGLSGASYLSHFGGGRGGLTSKTMCFMHKY